MHTARYYTQISPAVIQCDLCPHGCVLAEGEHGLCGVRTNIGGNLITRNYGRLSSIAEDPIEKKPLYHFFPGKSIISIGSVGCNFHCLHCQNEQISQCIGIEPGLLENYASMRIVQMAKLLSPPLLAFTYNEPIVSFEYVMDTARLASEAGIQAAMITNGYINTAPLVDLLPYIEAFNVDLKAYNNDFYKKITGGQLRPVLNSLEKIHAHGRHVEITYLVIPGLNDNPDDFQDLTRLLMSEFGRAQVLHISRYFPGYKMDLPPTPLDVIENFVDIARDSLHFVYPGNTGNTLDSNTYCPRCRKLVIRREGYTTVTEGLENGRCAYCENDLNIIA